MAATFGGKGAGLLGPAHPRRGPPWNGEADGQKHGGKDKQFPACPGNEREGQTVEKERPEPRVVAIPACSKNSGVLPDSSVDARVADFPDHDAGISDVGRTTRLFNNAQLDGLAWADEHSAIRADRAFDSTSPLLCGSALRQRSRANLHRCCHKTETSR